jgi:Leucine-rich repeat (LRR) protein
MGGKASKKKQLDEAKLKEEAEEQKVVATKATKDQTESLKNFEKAIDSMKRTKALRAETDENLAEYERMHQSDSNLFDDGRRPEDIVDLVLRAKKLDVLSLRNKVFEDFLPRATSLISLTIDHCRMNEFPSPLPIGLRRLNLNHNMIASIDVKAQRPLTELETLEIASNNLTELVELISLKSLVYLNMSRNNISKVHEGALRGLECLKEINLSKNSITDLNITLQDVPNLEVLLLSKNMLGGLPADFCNAENVLKVLKISQNPLTRLPESIGNLKALYHLDIRSTKLSAFPFSFKDCTSIEKFTMERTSTTNVPKIHITKGVGAIRTWLRDEEAKKKSKEESKVRGSNPADILVVREEPKGPEEEQKASQLVQSEEGPDGQPTGVQAVIKGAQFTRALDRVFRIVKEKADTETGPIQEVKSFLERLQDQRKQVIGEELNALASEEHNLTRRMLTVSSLIAAVKAYLADIKRPEKSALVSTSPYFVGRIGIYQSATKLLTYAGFRLKDYHSKGLMYEVPRGDNGDNARETLEVLEEYLAMLKEVYYEEQLKTDY